MIIHSRSLFWASSGLHYGRKNSTVVRRMLVLTLNTRPQCKRYAIYPRNSLNAVFHGESFCRITVKNWVVHLLSRPRFCDICLSQAATLKLAISIATRSTALFHKLSTFVSPRDKLTNRNSSSHRRRTCMSCELVSISNLDSVPRFSCIRLDSKSTVAMHFGTQSMK